MKLKKYFFILVIIFFNINYSYSIEADVFVQSTVNRASKVLSENISKDDKISKLKSIALETVDIRGIGFYTLGPIRKNLNDKITVDFFSLRLFFMISCTFFRLYHGTLGYK